MKKETIKERVIREASRPIVVEQPPALAGAVAEYQRRRMGCKPVPIRQDGQVREDAGRPDNDEVRKANVMATVATSHAMEMKTEEAHRLAARAHRDVATMHRRCSGRTA